MIIDLLMWPAICGFGVALVSGPLGSFMVWRRMAYFGDTLGHAALLGVAAGVFFQVSPRWAVLISSVLLALMLVALQRQKMLADDTLLGILSHSALAAGLVCVGLLADTRIDLYTILFGDLLTARASDAIAIYVMALLILAVLSLYWQKLLSATLDEDLAKVEGIATEKLRTLLLVLTAVVVAFAMKVVGVLLITALLIIPAAASRRISKTPEFMAIGASVIGMVAVILGLAASYFIDSPAGPSIVLAASAQFALSWPVARWMQRNHG